MWLPMLFHDASFKLYIQPVEYHVVWTTIIYLLLLLSHFSCVWLCVTPEMAAHQAPHPWDSPGKNTGVGCHFLLQCMKVKSESEVTQLCPTLSDPTDCSLPGSSFHGISQARVLEWGATATCYISPILHSCYQVQYIQVHVSIESIIS